MGKLIQLTRWTQNAFLIAIVQIEGKQKLVTCKNDKICPKESLSYTTTNIHGIFFTFVM
jgi:hypothetical protein